MTDDPTVEAVAEAIAHTRIGAHRIVWRYLTEDDKELYRAEARAAIAALELTEERRTLTDGWIQPTRNAMYYAQGLEPPPAVITHEARLVTPWREEKR